MYFMAFLPEMGVLGQNGGRDGAMFTPNELLFTFVGFYVCADFGENTSRNASVRVRADGHSDRGKLPHAISYI